MQGNPIGRIIIKKIIFPLDRVGFFKVESHILIGFGSDGRDPTGVSVLVIGAGFIEFPNKSEKAVLLNCAV